MQHAQVFCSQLAIDPKRIVATSAAIALHVAVLMLLMLPAQLPSRPALEDDQPLVIVPQAITKKPEPILPLQEHPRARHAPALLPPHREQTRETPVDEQTTAVSTDVEQEQPVQAEAAIAQTAPPGFAQISADRSPAPPYPQVAISRHLSGTVILLVRVSASGQPLEVSVDGSSGVHVLDEAARKFVLARWHFIPATQGGQPIEAYARVPIRFELEQ